MTDIRTVARRLVAPAILGILLVAVVPATATVASTEEVLNVDHASDGGGDAPVHVGAVTDSARWMLHQASGIQLGVEASSIGPGGYDYRPDFARPPSADAALDDPEPSSDASDPAAAHSRVCRVSSGLVLDRVAPRPTLAGRTVLGGNWDDAVRAGRRAKPLDGFHDVVAHGTPTGIYDDVGNLLSPTEAAAVIRGTPSWGGQNIRLLSCSTGCPTGNFVQGLADELGVAVRAPTVDFYVNSRGVPVLDPGGQWLTYLPGGG